MAGLQLTGNAKFGLGIQQGSGASDYLKMAAGYEQYVSINDNFYWYSLTDLSHSPVKVQVPLPRELGGRALTAGTFPTGTWGAGPISMLPRLDNRLGWLLLAAFGDVSTIADTKIENLSLLGGVEGADTGIHSHIFYFNDADQLFIPWLTMRRYLPHTTAASSVGESFQDGKIGAFTMTAAAGAPLTIDIDLLSRLFQQNYVFDYNPSWGTATYDEFDSFGASSCDGHFKVGGVEFNVTNMTLTLVNNVLPPQQSVIIGTTHPVDYPNLSRNVAVTATFLVSDYDFYVSTFKGSAATTDSNVACQIYQADLDVMVASVNYISGTEPYKMRFISNQSNDNVVWSVAPLRFMPDRSLVVTATATVQALSTGYPVYAILQNDKANYTLPSPV